MVVRSMLWVVLVLSLLIGSTLLGSTMVSGRLQEDVACRWLLLAASDERTSHTLIDMPLRGVVAHSGAATGAESPDLRDDVALLRLSSGLPGAWQPITTTGEAPGGRMNHAAVLRVNPVGGFQMVTYGGESPAEVHDDTHVLDVLPVGGRWSSLAAANADTRTEHSAVYRTGRDEVVVFGGRRTGEPSSVVDTVSRLAFAPVTRWDELTPAGDGPSARMGHSAVYDEDGDRMIVFGGTADYTAAFTDTWSLNFAGDMPTWELIATTGVPPAGRFAHAATYLPSLRWMVVFGGTTDASGDLGDLHALDLSEAPPRWLELHPLGSRQPPAMQGLAAAFSSAAQVAVFYGGQSAGTALGDTWALQCEPIDATSTVTPTNTVEAPSATPTVEPSATPTADSSAVPTPGPADIRMFGSVYVAGSDPAAAIEGVRLTVPPCQTSHQPFTTTSGADGRYELLLPGPYFVPGCTIEVTLTADGYQTYTDQYSYEALINDPERDFALTHASSSATPSSTPTAGTPGATTATPTTGPQGLEMTGKVAEADAEPEVVIVGARIRVPPCNTPHQDFEATSGSDGRYALVLPLGYFGPGCLVEVNVTARGYEPASLTIDYAELEREPVRDFALAPIPVTSGATIFLPFAESGP